MKSNLCIYNSKIVPLDSVHISPDNRSFKYGDGLFETIRVMNGKLLFLHAHYERLARGLDLLRIDKSNLATVYKLDSLVAELLKVSGVDESARVRVHLWRNGGGLYTPEENTMSYLVEVSEIAENQYVLNEKGLKIGLYDTYNDCKSMLASKTASSLPYILASLHKKEQSLDDVLLVSENGNIVEATSSNVFCILNNEILTPPLSSGCIDGVFRRQLLNLNDVIIRETEISREMLSESSEVFITNVIKGIQWIETIGMQKYSNKIIVDIYNNLLKQIL